jgi:hypothetical protein
MTGGKMSRNKMQDPNDPMAILARIALEDQAEKADDRNRKKRSRDVALSQMHRSELENRSKSERFQGICDHLLGNHRVGVKPRDPKSALHKHYQSDKSLRIYCSKCRFDWYPGDKADKIVRLRGDGLVTLPNPSHKSWKEINEFFYSFENSADLTTRAFRLERVELEDIDSEEAKFIAAQLPVVA